MGLSNLWTTGARSLVRVPFVCAGSVEKSRSSCGPLFWLVLVSFSFYCYQGEGYCLGSINFFFALSNHRRVWKGQYRVSRSVRLTHAKYFEGRDAKVFLPYQFSSLIDFQFISDSVLCFRVIHGPFLEASYLNLVTFRHWSTTFIMHSSRNRNRKFTGQVVCFHDHDDKWWSFRRLWWWWRWQASSV